MRKVVGHDGVNLHIDSIKLRIHPHEEGNNVDSEFDSGIGSRYHERQCAQEVVEDLPIDRDVEHLEIFIPRSDEITSTCTATSTSNPGLSSGASEDLTDDYVVVACVGTREGLSRVPREQCSDVC